MCLMSRRLTRCSRVVRAGRCSGPERIPAGSRTRARVKEDGFLLCGFTLANGCSDGAEGSWLSFRARYRSKFRSSLRWGVGRSVTFILSCNSTVFRIALSSKWESTSKWQMLTTFMELCLVLHHVRVASSMHKLLGVCSNAVGRIQMHHKHLYYHPRSVNKFLPAHSKR